MGEIVNLRRHRKAAARTAAEVEAAANRALHGRTRGEKLRDTAEADRARRALEGARLEEQE